MDDQLESKSLCGIHKNEPLTSFCLYHYQPCCPKCVEDVHRSCEEIQPINDDVTSTHNQSLINSLIGKLEETNSMIQSVVSERWKNLEDLHSKHKELEASIAELRETINKHFDELEYNLHQEVFITHTKCVKKIRKQIREFEVKQETLQEHINVLELLKKKKRGDNLNDLKEIARNQKSSEEFVKSEQEHLYHIDYELKLKSDIVKLKSNLKKFGEIEIQRLPIATFDKNRVEKSQTKRQHEGNITEQLPEEKEVVKGFSTSRVDKSSLQEITQKGSSQQRMQLYAEDKNEGNERKQLQDCIAMETKTFSITPKIYDPFITGGTFLPDEKQLLLADMGNSKLYIVNESGFVESEIGLSDEPFDVAMVTDSTAAVTIPKQNLIQYLDVHTERLGKQFRLRERPWGICFNGKYILTICDTSIVSLDLRGSFIRKYDVTGDVEYIAASDSLIYYTAGNMPILRCLSLDGKEVFKNVYKNLNQPAGISLDRQGHVYVVGSKSCNVHQLDPNGKLIKIIVSQKNTSNIIRNIKFDASGEQFFLTSDDGKIKVFQLDYPGK